MDRGKDGRTGRKTADGGGEQAGVADGVDGLLTGCTQAVIG